MHIYTRFNNAGSNKIYDDAMAWILLGFLDAPLWGLYYAARALLDGCEWHVTLYALKSPWKHQMRVWNSL